jgi:2-haloacid dehalogenase
VAERWASFDCYGTLVDWNGGIRNELARLWPDADADEMLERYHEIEPRVQLDGGLPYREVLTQALVLLAESEGLELARGEEDALARSLPSWRPFPEVTASLADLRDRGWRIGILTNCDPDLLASSLKTIGVEVDVRITAAEAHAYKPAFAHWDTFFRTTMADRERHVHVAASLYHDVEPCAQLGLPCVWINRLYESSDLPRAGELSNLAGLPAALDALVPE